MTNLRCSKCGSDTRFLITTADKKVLEVRGHITTDKILKTVMVTCTYCNNTWDHVPITLRVKDFDEVIQPRPKLMN